MAAQVPDSTAGDSAVAALKAHRSEVTLIVVAATLLGLLLGLLHRPVFTAETRLAVGAGELSTLAIPGFPTASKDLAAGYARWVTLQGVGEFNAPAEAIALTASPIPESNVIRIEAKSADEQVARDTANSAAAALLAEVNKVRAGNDPEALLTEIVTHAPELSQAVARSTAALHTYDSYREDRYLKVYMDIDAVRTRLQVQQDARMDRYRKLVADRTAEADLRTIGQGARITGNDRVSTIQRYGLLGFALGSVLALAYAVLFERLRLGERFPWLERYVQRRKA